MGQNNSSPENSSQDAPPPAQTRIPPPPRSVRDVYWRILQSEDRPRLSGEIQRQMRDQITGLVEDPRDPQANFFRRHLTLHQNPPLLISRGTTLRELSMMGERLSMQCLAYKPSPSFLASEAAQVTIQKKKVESVIPILTLTFFTGTGRHRVQIAHFFRGQIGSWRSLGLGLVVGSRRDRTRHQCSSLVLSESPGSKPWPKDG